MSPVPRLEAVADAAESALAAIQAELDSARRGRDSVDSLNNLTFIEGRLREILSMLRTGAIRRDERLLGSMGRLIVDTWPLRHPLGERIAKIEYDFERL